MYALYAGGSNGESFLSCYYPPGESCAVVDYDEPARPDTTTPYVPLRHHPSCYKILVSSYVTEDIPVK